MRLTTAGSGPRESARFAFYVSGAGPLLRSVRPRPSWGNHRYSMGAWGTRIFESDSALDWAANLCAVGGVASAVRSLVGTNAHELIGHEQRGEEILIAAELLIAIRLGRPLPAFPAELAALIDDENQSDDLLYETRDLVPSCIAKLKRVRDGQGGQAALWANKQGTVSPKWLDYVDALIRHLSSGTE